MANHTNRIISLFVFLLLFFVFGCNSGTDESVLSYMKIAGKTMGTTYHITYADDRERNFQNSIDSLFEAINEEVSTYIPTSTISRFNQSRDTFDLGFELSEYQNQTTQINRHFFTNFLSAKTIHKKTQGYFEPTVMPLVNYWGFGYAGKKPVERIDSVKIAELMPLIGVDKTISMNEKTGNSLSLIKIKPGTQLDFSGIAKGYAVDEVGRFLEKYGIKHYLAEIGGETKAKGLNPQSRPWSVGINTPKADAAIIEFTEVAVLENKAIATSGDYRQFYEIEGEKYSHIINPRTGFSEKSNLLSVSVIANDCMTADGYATAFFVLGKDKGIKLANQLNNIEALFIYATPDGSMESEMTDNFGAFLRKNY